LLHRDRIAHLTAQHVRIEPIHFFHLEFIMSSIKSTSLQVFTALACVTAFAITVNVTHAAGTETRPIAAPAAADYNAGKTAVENKQWKVAAAHFNRAATLDPESADAWNMLGYSSRWAGNYKDAFAAYDKALKIDPTHVGAHSYLGVAYVKTDDLTKARAQLVTVEKLCGSTDCDEYKLLSKAISEYKAK
jgi:cytochrome c-type biogenesis protein CcmH/NrfG